VTAGRSRKTVALLFVAEFQLENNAPPVIMLLPPRRAVGDRGLGEVVAVGAPPAAHRELPVEDLA
jgi:hypothetical protein